MEDKEFIEENIENTTNATADETPVEEQEELTPEQQLQKELDEANEKIANLEDKYLRQAAEFDNYRKRTIKEKAELIKNGGERAIESILPVLDDFERAIQTMSKDENERTIITGQYDNGVGDWNNSYVAYFMANGDYMAWTTDTENMIFKRIDAIPELN